MSTVPPRLTNDAAGGTVQVQEGGRAELVCNATGVPSPTLTWYRYDGVGPGRRRHSEYSMIHYTTRYI